MNFRRWLHEHSLKLLAIRDTPGAIAGGVGIGVFIGFLPLFGIKTLLTIVLAWLTGCNIIAAVLAETAHDVFLPLMPAVYVWEYELGYWLLSSPHHWPPIIPKLHGLGFSWQAWIKFLMGIGKPMLLGGAVCSAPIAVICFFLTHSLVRRRHERKQALAAAEPSAPGPGDTPR